MAAQIQQPIGRVALGVLDVNLPSPVTSSSNKHILYSSNSASFSKGMDAGARPSLPLSPSISPVQISERSPLGGTKRKLGMLGKDVEARPERRSVRHNDGEEDLLHEETHWHAERDSTEREQMEESPVDAQINETDCKHVLERESDQVGALHPVPYAFSDLMLQLSEGTPRESPAPSSTFDTTQDTQNTATTEPEDIATGPTAADMNPPSHGSGAVTRQLAREVHIVHSPLKMHCLLTRITDRGNPSAPSQAGHVQGEDKSN